MWYGGEAGHQQGEGRVDREGERRQVEKAIVQGDAGQPGCQGGGQEKNRKKCRAKEEEWHKGPLTPRKRKKGPIL
jgi:hypothetical protein